MIAIMMLCMTTPMSQAKTVSTYDDPIQGYTNAKSLNLRSEPDKTSKLLGTYNKGTTVQIIGDNGDWYNVDVSGSTGYMLKQYVSVGTAPIITDATTTKSSNTTSSSKTKSSGKYVGSSEKNIFHVPSCRWAKKILPSNEVWWSSRDEAIASGRKACKVCKP